MEGGFPSLVGLAFLLLALWRAIRVRRDLAASVTRWDRALFGHGEPVSRAVSPAKFWCVIAVNTVVVLLLALVAVVALRITTLRRM